MLPKTSKLQHSITVISSSNTVWSRNIQELVHTRLLHDPCFLTRAKLYSKGMKVKSWQQKFNS